MSQTRSFMKSLVLKSTFEVDWKPHCYVPGKHYETMLSIVSEVIPLTDAFYVCWFIFIPQLTLLILSQSQPLGIHESLPFLVIESQFKS